MAASRPTASTWPRCARCPLVVTVTPAQVVCLDGPLRPDAFVAAVGAFTPKMIELAPSLTRQLAASGAVVIDSAAARHEAGDLLAAGLAMHGLPTLAEAVEDLVRSVLLMADVSRPVAGALAKAPSVAVAARGARPAAKRPPAQGPRGPRRPR